MQDGLLLGFMAWASLMLSWWHTPLWFKRLSVNHFVLTDVLATILTYLTISSFSHSLVAVAACISSGLLTNITMMILGHPKVRSMWMEH